VQLQLLFMVAFIFGSMLSDSHKKTQFLEETGFFIFTSTMATHKIIFTAVIVSVFSRLSDELTI